MPQGWIFLPLVAVIHGNKGKSGFQPMAACLFVISRTSARLINVPPLPLPPGSVFAPSSGVKLISNSRRAARRRGALRPRAEIIVPISMAASGFSVDGRARNRVLDPPPSSQYRRGHGGIRGWEVSGAFVLALAYPEQCGSSGLLSGPLRLRHYE